MWLAESLAQGEIQSILHERRRYICVWLIVFVSVWHRNDGLRGAQPIYGIYRTGLNPRFRQSRLVTLARILLPVLAEAVLCGLLVGVGAQFLDIDVDAETRRGRQVDPAVLDRETLDRDVAADLLEIDEVLGDPEIRDHRRDVHGRRHPNQRRIVVVRRHHDGVRLRHHRNI
jgi:hypothetical protein